MLHYGQSFGSCKDATLLADKGADATLRKRDGSWKSSNIKEEYMKESIDDKNEIIVKTIASKINSIQCLQSHHCCHFIKVHQIIN